MAQPRRRPKPEGTPKGLVIGKFYPLHKGHSYLMETALGKTGHLDILVCDSPRYTIPAEQRVRWIEHLHPEARVHVIQDIEKDDDSEAWAAHTTDFLGYAPDIVFSSEDYGYEYARLMGAEHVMVDRDRTRIPVSARYIRRDALAHWDFLEPAVRANYAIRVCVLGAESTGTTTLARTLAEHYGTVWVPEYGRMYSEAFAAIEHAWSSQEFTHIATTQQTMEHQLAGRSNGLLICDTNAFATRLWHERYIGKSSKEVDKIANNDIIDLFIVTDVDIPFVNDGTRDGEHIRHDMHQRFLDEVAASGIPYIIASGNVDRRLKQSTQAIKTLTGKKVTI